MAIPNIFSGKGGQRVPAAQLDENFQYVMDHGTGTPGPPGPSIDSGQVVDGQLTLVRSDSVAVPVSGNITGPPGVGVLPITQFGATGGANDTTAFQAAEAYANASAIDLLGGTWRLRSAAVAGPVLGVRLLKNYVNGTLMVDGRKRIMDTTEGSALSGASGPQLLVPATSKKLGLFRRDQNFYYVWQPLGGRYWRRNQVSRTAIDIPFNYNETYLKQVLAYQTCEESYFTYSTATGVWTQLTSATFSLYINGRARQGTHVGDYVDITYNGSGNIFIIYTARPGGNYVNVTLDGGTSYLILPTDGSGNKYFDSYAASDTYKQVIQIASGVPAGNHTIRLTISSSKNPNNTGANQFQITAMAYDNDLVGPWLPVTAATVWAQGQVVLLNQERSNGGRTYSAASAGTTGNIPPTHTSGTVSDGGVLWTYRSGTGASSYDLTDQRIQGTGSQLEYAGEMLPVGATVKESFGGASHGNETQTSFGWAIENGPVNLSDQLWVTGDTVEIWENLFAWHPELGTGTQVITTKLRRTFSRAYLEIQHTHTIQIALGLGYFYSAMWPLIHYNASSGNYKFAVTDIWSPCDGNRHIADYYTNPLDPPYYSTDDQVSTCKEYVMVASGDAYEPDGVLGTPSSGPTGKKFIMWLQVDGEGLTYYRDVNKTFAGKSVNFSGLNPLTTDPNNTYVAKLYFMRCSPDVQTQFAVGDVLNCLARYGVALYNQ